MIQNNRTFTALRHPNYRLWFRGQMVSLFGSWMQVTAQGFLMFELTRSPAHLGYIGFAHGIPTWAFMLYAGVIADRVSRRKLLILTQGAMMSLAAATAVLAFSGWVRPWHLLLIAFGFGTANAFDAPARQAMVKELVPLEDMTNAIALNSAMFNGATALGPAIGGVVYALVGPGWCFTVNAVSYLAVIAALAAMKLDPFSPRPRTATAMAELKEGLRFVVFHPLIRTIIGLIAVTSLFGFAFATLVPAWAVDILGGGATTNGFLQSARGLGSLAGALLIASLGRFRFRGRLLTAGSIAFPLFLIVFSFVRGRPLAYTILFAAGFSLILVFNLSNAAVQTLIPDSLRGRVMSIYALTFFGSLPLGSLVIGGIAARIGAPSAVRINSAVMLAFAVGLVFLMPRLRRME